MEELLVTLGEVMGRGRRGVKPRAYTGMASNRVGLDAPWANSVLDRLIHSIRAQAEEG